MKGKKRTYTVTATPSTDGDPSSGRIIVTSEGLEKSIPALIFSPEKAERLLKIVDEVYAENNR